MTEEVRLLSELTHEDRRSYIRLPVVIPMRWSEPSARVGDAPLTHETQTRDLSATGFSFSHETAVPTGMHITVDFHPDFAESLTGVDGVVACSTPARVAPDGATVVGVRVVVAPGAKLQRLLLAAYEHAGEWTTVCHSVRHCGDLRKACPAFLANRNCWQEPGTPCCSWKGGCEHSDCAECPISVLAFMTP